MCYICPINHPFAPKGVQLSLVRLFWMDSLKLLDFSSFIIFSDDPWSLYVSFCQLFKLPLVVQCCNVICEWPLSPRTGFLPGVALTSLTMTNSFTKLSRWLEIKGSQLLSLFFRALICPTLTKISWLKPLLIKNWQSRISVLSADVSSHPFNIVQTYKVLRQKRYAPLEKA